MDIDDPRLEEARKKANERVQKYNDMMLTVLKNHIMVEGFLNDLLKAGSRRYKQQRTFGGKIEIAKGLVPNEITPKIWALLGKCNNLRNQIAHSFDEKKIAAKMADVRKAYLDALTPKQAEGLKDLDDVRIASGAFEICGSYIVVAGENLKKD